MFQNNNPNPSRKGFQKNSKLKGEPLYCCYISIPNKNNLKKVKRTLPNYSNTLIIGRNLFFGAENEIYSLYDSLEKFEDSEVYIATFDPNGDCETENT